MTADGSTGSGGSRTDGAGPGGDARLDRALVARGLARSRTLAARLVDAGVVLVDGVAVTKPSHRVGEGTRIDVSRPERYVSRAAHKLVAALDAFQGVDPSGRVALDLGASTGGFTQVLVERGVRHVLAIDVGHDQMNPAVADDPRVTSLEGVNARDLDAASLRERLPGDAPDPADIDLVVGDLSFISLRHVLAPIRRTVRADADLVLLVKPQFEVGRTGVRGGIVTDPALARDAVRGVLDAAHATGLGIRGIIASPIEGTHGNRELVVHFAPDGTDPTEWTRRLDELTTGGRA
ncbi:TlyA family RNA methyltransferase [Pseudoclavibacter chungangensis]|uniref:TlyA family RNA methyltransferase n=1 Tax=Pseudoclavibacter chungangensis TaxID=587635 RepID=A0A7J5BNN8_9MICO|nr:TlyA family RNA methyltransferase [Pseudoclavibacter chungangensis]KAB1653284.1 TlyA family RNA methyltransferase [Pseudoclavibacter chungangensis]NYJ66973.1 23S rRNA (cytidine1920-2'-O)/16S rRNA (cytidine1409-2'-O)-methyltransferase [Pseudoclavibacter chungangensis]